MKSFRTEFKPQNSLQIEAKEGFLSLGSCFAEVFGRKLEHYKLKGYFQPFGTVFNPHSLHKLLALSLAGGKLSAEGYLQREGLYFHYDLPTTWRAESQAGLAAQWQSQQAKMQHFWQTQSPKYIILTYGTAWVYHLKAQGEIVANCHKQPADFFEKSTLSLRQITESFEDIYQQLQEKLEEFTIILSLSPVRHLKEGFAENNYSKSLLRVAIEQIKSQYSNVHYFPAYEILQDDLRDYRFYAADLLHPSPEAEHYIWQHFVEMFLGEDLQQWFQLWEPISKALAHRPINPNSAAHQAFLRRLLDKITRLDTNFDLQQERQIIELQIST